MFDRVLSKVFLSGCIVFLGNVQGWTLDAAPFLRVINLSGTEYSGDVPNETAVTRILRENGVTEALENGQAKGGFGVVYFSAGYAGKVSQGGWNNEPRELKRVKDLVSRIPAQGLNFCLPRVVYETKSTTGRLLDYNVQIMNRVPCAGSLENFLEELGLRDTEKSKNVLQAFGIAFGKFQQGYVTQSGRAVHACVHGDLNARNVLIHSLSSDGKNTAFTLIDIAGFYQGSDRKPASPTTDICYLFDWCVVLFLGNRDTGIYMERIVRAFFSGYVQSLSGKLKTYIKSVYDSYRAYDTAESQIRNLFGLNKGYCLRSKWFKDELNEMFKVLFTQALGAVGDVIPRSRQILNAPPGFANSDRETILTKESHETILAGINPRPAAPAGAPARANQVVAGPQARARNPAPQAQPVNRQLQGVSTRSVNPQVGAIRTVGNVQEFFKNGEWVRY